MNRTAVVVAVLLTCASPALPCGQPPSLEWQVASAPFVARVKVAAVHRLGWFSEVYELEVLRRIKGDLSPVVYVVKEPLDLPLGATAIVLFSSSEYSMGTRRFWSELDALRGSDLFLAAETPDWFVESDGGTRVDPFFELPASVSTQPIVNADGETVFNVVETAAFERLVEDAAVRRPEDFLPPVPPPPPPPPPPFVPPPVLEDEDEPAATPDEVGSQP